ncbi:MAG TPA: hypothetical protein VD886_03280 [Herpetosiphonaceae bacterium]|nr:hypothetical protein [Herpetosiphonaceae bacterium]
MECRLCSRPVPNDALRCPHCHWTVNRNGPARPSQPAPPTCGGCARILPEDATYCEYCGWSADVGEPPAPPVPPAEPPPVAEIAQPTLALPAPPRVKPGDLFQITSVPLTGAQKRELIVNIVGPPLSLVIFIVVLTLIPKLMGAMSYGQVLDRVPPFWGWLVGFLLLIGAYGWLQSVRDLGRGIAYVQLTRLTGTRAQRTNKRTRYYGFFENIGKVEIGGTLYGESSEGSIYKITYSPVSKRAWEVELIEHPPRLIPEHDAAPLPH